MIDSIKRFAPGSNPLAPLPFSAAEREELIARVRAAGRRVRENGGRAKLGTTIPPKRLADLRAERTAARESALALARSNRAVTRTPLPSAPGHTVQLESYISSIWVEDDGRTPAGVVRWICSCGRHGEEHYRTATASCIGRAAAHVRQVRGGATGRRT